MSRLIELRIPSLAIWQWLLKKVVYFWLSNVGNTCEIIRFHLYLSSQCCFNQSIVIGKKVQPCLTLSSKTKTKCNPSLFFFIALSQLLNIYIICLPTKLLNVYKVVKTLHLKLILLSQINKLYEFWQTRAFKLFA